MFYKVTLVPIYLLILSLSAISQDYSRYSSIIDKLALSSECQDTLKTHYESGKTLAVKSIQLMAHNLESYNTDKEFGRELQHNYFFHYTDHPYDNKDRTLDPKEIFSYYKVRSLYQFGTNAFGAAIYIANDPYSSKEFGKYLVRLKLASNAKVLHHHDLIKIDWDKIDKDLGPISDVCDIEYLKPIIVEDSNIDVIKYTNYYSHAIWLQLLNSRSILEAKFSKRSRRLRRGFTKWKYDYED